MPTLMELLRELKRLCPDSYREDIADALILQADYWDWRNEAGLNPTLEQSNRFVICQIILMHNCPYAFADGATG